MKIGKMEDLKDVCQSLAGPSGSNIMLHIILVPEPQLWVSATGNDGCLDTRTPWCHGAGTWLVEAKAEKYLGLFGTEQQYRASSFPLNPSPLTRV